MFLEQQILIRMISEGSRDTEDWSNATHSNGYLCSSLSDSMLQYYRQHSPIFILLQVALVEHVISQERLSLIQLGVVPVVAQVFLDQKE